MPNARKIKRSKGTVAKPCTKCYNPKYLKFNFSYFKPPKGFRDEYKAQLINRILVLSAEPYVTILKWPKGTGLEFEDLDTHRELPSEFKSRFDDKYYSKVAVIRLYPNNNPIEARVTGYVIKNIFYVMDLFIGDNKGYKR